MRSALDDPGYWRSRAEEMRTLAEIVDDAEEKQLILHIAEGYERMEEKLSQPVPIPWMIVQAVLAAMALAGEVG